MSNSVKEHIVSALRRLMEPIIRILLRNGVTYKEFSLLCKNIFVEAASRDFGIRGRPTNVSRISVLTGIDRKEVKRIKDLLKENTQSYHTQQSQDRLTRLLSGWYQDEEFVDTNGVPVPLTIEGESGSFALLAKRYGGDIPANALLKELLRGGVVEELPDGRLRALKRYYFPSTSDPEALLRAGSVIYELSNTLFHNLYEADTSGSRKKEPRFERRATNNRVALKHQKAFKAFLDQEGQDFLERVDDWLSRHEVDPETTDEIIETSKNKPTKAQSKALRLGVGVYFIEDEENNLGENA